MFDMENANGINAFAAHQAHVGDDNTFVRGIIGSYNFAVFGTVTKYADERVDVICGAQTFTNVEVMVFGIDGWGIKPIPAVNDRVLLVGTRSAVVDLKKFEASGSMPAYDASGLKAIPITDSKTAQLISVSKDGVEVTGNNKVTINDDGIQVEDKNGNKVITSSDGVSFEDTNGNKVDTTDSGVAFEDLNGNKFTSNDEGTVTEDKNSNKITTNGDGISIEDTNGCTVVTSSSSVVINDKLEVKK